MHESIQDQYAVFCISVLARAKSPPPPQKRANLTHGEAKNIKKKGEKKSKVLLKTFYN